MILSLPPLFQPIHPFVFFFAIPSFFFAYSHSRSLHFFPSSYSFIHSPYPARFPAKMLSIQLLTPFLLLALPAALASTLPRQAKACFVVGNSVLPAEVADTAAAIQQDVTCGRATTIASVPDVTSGSVSFSDINFADSDLSPLGFALQEFATATPLASTDLALFTDRLNTYLATGKLFSPAPEQCVPKTWLWLYLARRRRRGVCGLSASLTMTQKEKKKRGKD